MLQKPAAEEDKRTAIPQAHHLHSSTPLSFRWPPSTASITYTLFSSLIIYIPHFFVLSRPLHSSFYTLARTPLPFCTPLAAKLKQNAIRIIIITIVIIIFIVCVPFSITSSCLVLNIMSVRDNFFGSLVSHCDNLLHINHSYLSGREWK